MIITTKIRTDLVHPSVPVTVYAVQGDQNTRILELALYANGAAWPVPDDATFAVRYRKPDGTKGYYDTLPDSRSACFVTGNIVSVMLAPQMLTVAGFVEAQLEIISGTDILGTFSVNISVAADPAAGVLASEDYVNWLNWLTGKLDAAVHTATDAAKTQTFHNKRVSFWINDSVYADFPYRGCIPCEGVTEEMFTEVVFPVEEAMSGEFAPVCQSYNGGVYIWAAVHKSMTIPTITAWR